MKTYFAMLVLFFQVAVAWASPSIINYDSRIHPVASADKLGMVVSQERLASDVGSQILAAGGNAVDAAVATGFALAVTYPQAGNIGGGGFMMIYLAKEQRTIAIDYREKAPSAADRNMFLNADGQVDNQKARFSLASAGVPGTVKGLVYAQQKYGKLSLKQVMQPAIKLAQKGFPISSAQAFSFDYAAKRFVKHAASRQYFLNKDGSPMRSGQILRQKDLAKTLKRIVDTDGEDFYTGTTAKLLVQQMNADGGLISAEDLKNYNVVERKPIVGSYRGYDVISMPPPSSGGIHLVQMLNMLSHWDIGSMGHNSSDYVHRLVEVMKRAYADRSAYLGDSDFYPVPRERLTSREYADSLVSNIDTDSASPRGSVKPGLDNVDEDKAKAAATARESPQTTHFNVYDKDGNIVSNTYTLNFSYGSGIAVPGAGFLLNNEMDDFSAKPGSPNGYGLVGGEANAIEAAKRPLSSMTPSILLKDGKPMLLVGALGGSRIITSVLQTIVNVVDFDMNIAEAISAPRVHHQWLPDTVYYEKGFPVDTVKILAGMGHQLKASSYTLAKVLGIRWQEGTLSGSFDPRWPGGGVAIEADK